MDEKKYLRRIIFLETVAGVPGMVAGMLRHVRARAGDATQQRYDLTSPVCKRHQMKSLRAMQRDHGWIHTLLEEAENERMHLLTFLRVRNPGIMFRSCVLVAQGCVTRHHSFARSLQPHSLTHTALLVVACSLVFNAFFLCYLIAPRVCHRFVGYLEEEAVKTYTK